MLERTKRLLRSGLRPRPRVRAKRKEGVPTILITGGLGFIFSYVTEYFVAKGWNVIVVDNESVGSHPSIVDGSFTHYNVHVANPAVIDLVLQEKPDYVIHAAAISDVDYSIRESYRTFKKNIMMNVNIFDACRQLPDMKKFMYVSTDEIYGECERPMKEGDALSPRSPYACSKAVGSLMHMTYANTFPEFGAKLVETRFCNVFGPRQDERKIFGAIKKALKTGNPLTLHNEGAGYREYLYVKNMPEVVDLILREGTGSYNVSTNDGYTVKEILKIVQEITGTAVPTIPGRREGMDMRYNADASRIRALGWKPRYSFPQGLKEYLEG